MHSKQNRDTIPAVWKWVFKKNRFSSNGISLRIPFQKSSLMMAFERIIFPGTNGGIPIDFPAKNRKQSSRSFPGNNRNQTGGNPNYIRRMVPLLVFLP